MGRGRRDRDGARGASLDQPPDLAAGGGSPPAGVLHACHARLGPVARPRALPAVQPRVCPVQVARLVGLRHRGPGRHGLSHHGRRVLDAQPRLPDADRAGIDPTLHGNGAGQLPHHLLLRGPRWSARSEGHMARREPLPAAPARGARRCPLAARHERPALDRDGRQTARRHLRRRPAAARSREAGGDSRAPARAEIPAVAGRPQGVDRGV